MNTFVTSALAARDLPRSADAVIIGGGVNGASTAFQLAKRGVRRVVLLERRQLGAGATGKSGALVRTHYSNVPEAELTAQSMTIFRNWAEEVGFGDPGFEVTGFLRVVRPDDDARLRANVASHQRLGIDSRIVSAEEIREIEPLMRTDDIHCAAFEPNSGFADPNATLYGFIEAAVRAGADIRVQTTATELTRSGDRITGVVTDRGTIATDQVLVAAGAWANRLLSPLGVDLGLQPRRIQVAVFRWPVAVDPNRRHRVVIDSTQHSWFRPEGRAGTLIGVESSHEPIDPDTYRESVDEAYISRARAALAARFPVFATATMRGAWSGVVMQSPDDHPIIDQIPSVPGLFVITGDSGSSFKTAPATGICLAQWMTEGGPALMDLRPFRSTRFAEGVPWVDEHAYDPEHEATISR
ncbi:MAG TPA: FAD-binding oxidoreductase [Thermomicrobiales bacterium]|nr:FAD-binding oxidoreductase [Thermomicrobiales bacterium]